MKDLASGLDRKVIVLVVDDDPSIGLMLCKMMKFDFIECKEATTIDEGLRLMAQKPPPDYVFLDLGFVATRDTPASRPEQTVLRIPEFRKYNPKAPITLISGLIDDKIYQMTHSIPVDSMEQKPFEGQVAIWQSVLKGIDARTAAGESPYDATAKLYVELQEQITRRLLSNAS